MADEGVPLLGGPPTGPNRDLPSRPAGPNSRLTQAGSAARDLRDFPRRGPVLLAILRPDLKVTACESVGKKALAVKDIVKRAGIPAEVHNCRAETLLDDNRYDAAIARAVGPLY